MTCLLSALLLCASSAAASTNANTAAFNRGGTTFGWNQQVPSSEMRAFVGRGSRRSRSCAAG